MICGIQIKKELGALSSEVPSELMWESRGSALQVMLSFFWYAKPMSSPFAITG